MNTIQNNQEILLVATPETIEKVTEIKHHLEDILSVDVQTYTMPYDKFADTAHNVEFKQSISGKNIFIYADCYSDDPSWDLWSKYMFHRHILSACQENRAKNINIIYPCFPYSRSDKEPEAGWNNTSKKVSIMAPWVLDDAHRHWVNSLITVDIHNQWVLSRWWNKPQNIVNLYYKWMIDYALQWMDKNNTEIWSTDWWWTKKIEWLAQVIELNNYVAFKSRNKTEKNSVKKLFIEKGCATIHGKDIIIYDDMIDTWWTMCKVIEELKNQWARSIKIVSPHGMFNNNALQKIKQWVDEWIVSDVIISDTITRKNTPERVTVLKSYKLFGNTIWSLLQWNQINRNAA